MTVKRPFSCIVTLLVLLLTNTALAQDPATGHSLRSLAAGDTSIGQRLMSAVGLVAMIGIAWLMSFNRKAFPKRIVIWGTGLQLIFGVFVLKTAAGLWLFSELNDAVVALLGFTTKGSAFIFGDFATKNFSFALNVLPTVIFFSSLMAVMYHLGVMQRVVNVIAKVMQWSMRTSGSETLSCAANIFVGQTEAPLLVRPFINNMTQSEVMAVMVGGFATVAGGVMAAYVGMLQKTFPDIAGHLISASVLSAPAAMVMAKVVLPETEVSETAGKSDFKIEKIDANIIDAAARGAGEGLQLALNVGAMLLAFIALVALVNYLITLPTELYNHLMGLSGTAAVAPITLEKILSYLFSPIAFLMGVPWKECGLVGTLLGERMVLNEFVSYVHLSEWLTAGKVISQRTVIIITYALCGFANFSSIAIQIGGIGSLAPGRRMDISKLGLRAMFAGTLASCMTACVAGILI